MSTKVQSSAVKLLGFLVNDMLDYGQLSAGKFRKQITKFNLNETVEEIINIMKFKADELGVKMIIQIECNNDD